MGRPSFYDCGAGELSFNLFCALQLSGHTHNGQLFPMNLIYRCVYELSWGHMKKGHTHFIVSSGVQVWGPPVRTAGDAEILLVNVKFLEEGI